MKTVAGVFDDFQTALRAVDHLLQAGFQRPDVHMQEGATGDARREAEEGKGMLASLGDFFSNLFGRGPDADPHDPSGHYAEAVRRGSSVVMANAASDEQVDQAAKIMQELGAVDINQRAEQWRQSGWTGYTNSPTPPSGQQMMVGPSGTAGSGRDGHLG